MSGELKNLTAGEFLHTLRQVVAERGANYVYPESERLESGACRYWHNGQPSCMIGHALDVLGLVVPPSLEGLSAPYVLYEFGAPVQVGRVAVYVQAAQDLGGSWGEALVAAERVAAA